MSSESPYSYKLDIRAIAATILQVSPIVLVIIYILEYTYVLAFLEQFGLTPEEIGISEIKLLTRAALLTLGFISIFSILFALLGALVAARMSIEVSPRTKKLLRRFNLINEPKVNTRGGLIYNIRNASRQARIVRNVGTFSFLLAFTLVILSLKPLGAQLGITSAIILTITAIVLSAILFVGWRSTSIRSLAYACGVILAVALLILTAIYGGIRTGYNAVRTGHVPAFVNTLGIDILQVHPEWINKSVRPPQYTQNQDLLELGSDATTAFLYDCWTGTTYRIPLDDVVVNYPLYLNKTTSATLRRLRCR